MFQRRFHGTEWWTRLPESQARHHLRRCYPDVDLAVDLLRAGVELVNDDATYRFTADGADRAAKTPRGTPAGGTQR